MVGNATAQSQKIQGVINGRSSPTRLVQTDSGNVTVVLNDSTEVKMMRGAFDLGASGYVYKFRMTSSRLLKSFRRMGCSCPSGCGPCRSDVLCRVSENSGYLDTVPRWVPLLPATFQFAANKDSSFHGFRHTVT